MLASYCPPHMQLNRSQTVSVLLQLLNSFDFLHGRHLHYMEMMIMILISCKFFT